MSKEAPVAYPSLISADRSASSAAPTAAATEQQHCPPLMRDLADQVVIYLNPSGHKELKRYALGADRKVHDLMLEAIEELAAKRGAHERMQVR